jgi:hypothetical protein
MWTPGKSTLSVLHSLAQLLLVFLAHASTLARLSPQLLPPGRFPSCPQGLESWGRTLASALGRGRCPGRFMAAGVEILQVSSFGPHGFL